MTCQRARAQALEQIRSGEPVLDAHFESCAACARFRDSQSALQTAFELLPQAIPVPHLEPPVEPRPARSSRRLWIPATVFGSFVILLVVAAHRSIASHRITSAPFLEIPYTAPLAPYERTQVVHMDVSVAALIAAGFDIHATDAGASLSADVLIGQDGRAHAIRIVPKPNFTRRLTQ
jgi:hypothetical protein